MSESFIAAIFAIKPGKGEEARKRIAELIDFVETTASDDRRSTASSTRKPQR